MPLLRNFAYLYAHECPAFDIQQETRKTELAERMSGLCSCTRFFIFWSFLPCAFGQHPAAHIKPTVSPARLSGRTVKFVYEELRRGLLCSLPHFALLTRTYLPCDFLHVTTFWPGSAISLPPSPMLKAVRYLNNSASRLFPHPTTAATRPRIVRQGQKRSRPQAHFRRFCLLPMRNN